VEDCADVRALYRAILEDHYCITEAQNGAALLEALEREQPDVVLLDMRLPDANGLSLLPAIKERWPETQVILLTGAAQDSEGMSAAMEAAKSGAFSLLSKSADFSLQTLLTGVSSAMERRFQPPGNNPLQPTA
jgi:DNA-binding NtrC family response regulator